MDPQQLQQQVFFHTQAINDLVSQFTAQIQNCQVSLQTVTNERNEVQNELNNIQGQLSTLNSQVSTLQTQLHTAQNTPSAFVAHVPNTLHNETALHNYQVIMSTNQKYVCKMQEDGNLVCYQGNYHTENNAFWASNTGGVGQGPFHLKMQNDGNLVVYQGNGQPTWSSDTWHKGTAPYRLVMQDDRNLVLYDSNNTATWASGTNI
jgi:hypothetical protein